jgi:hypothetical protein
VDLLIQKPLRWIGFLGLALLLPGCVSGLREARPDQPPGDDQVVLVGQAAFDPVVIPQDDAPGIDPMGFMSRYAIAFTDTPEGVVKPDSQSNLQWYAMVSPGKPFTVLAPRRTLFVRLLRSYSHTEWKEGTKLLGPAYERTMYYVACVGKLRIPIEKTDRYVYVGRIVCKHGDGEELLTADGSEEGLHSVLPPWVFKHQLVRRIARELGPETFEE